MLFPAPNNTMYAEKMGVVFKSRHFSVCIYYLLKVEGVLNLIILVCFICKLMYEYLCQRFSLLDGMMHVIGLAWRCLNCRFQTKINVQPNAMKIIKRLRTSSVFKNR